MFSGKYGNVRGLVEEKYLVICLGHFFIIFYLKTYIVVTR